MSGRVFPLQASGETGHFWSDTGVDPIGLGASRPAGASNGRSCTDAYSSRLRIWRRWLARATEAESSDWPAIATSPWQSNLLWTFTAEAVPNWKTRAAQQHLSTCEHRDSLSRGKVMPEVQDTDQESDLEEMIDLLVQTIAQVPRSEVAPKASAVSHVRFRKQQSQ